MNALTISVIWIRSPAMPRLTHSWRTNACRSGPPGTTRNSRLPGTRRSTSAQTSNTPSFSFVKLFSDPNVTTPLAAAAGSGLTSGSPGGSP